MTRGGPIDREIPTQLGPAEPGSDTIRHFVAANGRTISYLTPREAPEVGAPAVLLIHGTGVSARSWIYQLRGLGQSLQVIAMDLPGRGESEALPEPTVEGYADAAYDLVRAREIGLVVAVGHSLGGAVVQALAARHPERVTAVVLVSTCAKLPPHPGTDGLLWYLPGPARKAVFFWTAQRILFGPRAPAEAVRLGMDELRSCPPEVMRRDAAAAGAMDLEESARALRVPALLLCGSEDKLTPSALSRRLNELIPGARLEVVEGMGHMLPLEAPELVNQRIVDFVASVTRCDVRSPLATIAAARRSLVERLLRKVKALFRSNRQAM